MNDLKLNDILNTYKPTSVIFSGVFGKNELKPITRFPSCMIVNESNFGTRGTHWVPLYFDVNGNAEYFDSCGQTPVPDISKFIASYTRGYVKANKLQFQSNGSDVCGQYCIYYLVKRCTNNSMEKILSVSIHYIRKLMIDLFTVLFVKNSIMSNSLILETFNKPVDISNIIKLDHNSDWECCVDSYNLSSSDTTASIVRTDCNIVNYDRNIKTPTMLYGISNKFVAVQYYRWKPIIVKELTNFRIDIFNINNNNKQITVNNGSNVLIIFRRKN